MPGFQCIQCSGLCRICSQSCCPFTASQNSSVGIVMLYGLDGRGSIPGRGKRFSSTSQRPDHPPSYPVGTRDSFQWGERPGRVADHSPLSSAEVKNGGATPSLPTYVFKGQLILQLRWARNFAGETVFTIALQVPTLSWVAGVWNRGILFGRPCIGQKCYGSIHGVYGCKVCAPNSLCVAYGNRNVEWRLICMATSLQLVHSVLLNLPPHSHPQPSEWLWYYLQCIN
jgi:hypothetical protein